MSIDRQLLFGLGVGLILAATLLAAGGGRKPVSDVEVIRRAKALGMTFPGEQRLTLEAPEGKPTRKRAADAPAPATSTANGSDVITVVVPPGATASEVARILQSASLIANEQEFLQSAAAQEATTRLRSGTYQFPATIGVEALISSLLSGPAGR